MSNTESKTQERKGTVSILDAWLNSYKVFQSYQSEIAEKSLQHLQTQRNILSSTRETLDKMEEDKNKFVVEWKTAVENTIKSITNEQIEQLSAAWINQIEEINNALQKSSRLTNQSVLYLFTQSQKQAETNVKTVLEQQQKQSETIFHKIDLFTEQFKQAHQELLPN